MAPPEQPEAPVGRGALKQLFHCPRLLISTFFLGLAFFTFGFDGSVMSGVLAMTPFVDQFGTGITEDGQFLTATDISILSAVPTTGCLLGLPLAAWGGDRLGRKKTLILGCVVSAVGAALQTSAFGMAQIVIGRWIASAAIFIFIVISSTFLAEISPPALRGTLIGLSIVLIDAAAVLSSGINWDMSSVATPLSFRLPLGLQIMFPVVIALGLALLVDDSPTFHLTRLREGKALKVLRRLRQGYYSNGACPGTIPSPAPGSSFLDGTSSSSSSASSSHIGSSPFEVQLAHELASLKSQSLHPTIPVSWAEMFHPGPNLRRTLLALSIGNMQQLSGIAFATNYATIFIASLSSTSSPDSQNQAFLIVLCMSVLGLAGAVTGLFLVDTIGRRPLALTTFVVIFVIDLIIGILGFLPYSASPSIQRAIAAFSCLFTFFFAAGFGPLTYVVAGEMPTTRLRNKTNAFSFFVLACFSTVVVYVLPYIAREDAAGLGPKTYLIFAVWMAGCVVVTWLWLPETKGRSMAELDEMFEAEVPARRFKDYVCKASSSGGAPSTDSVEEDGRLTTASAHTATTDEKV